MGFNSYIFVLLKTNAAENDLQHVSFLFYERGWKDYSYVIPAKWDVKCAKLVLTSTAFFKVKVNTCLSIFVNFSLEIQTYSIISNPLYLKHRCVFNPAFWSSYWSLHISLWDNMSTYINNLIVQTFFFTYNSSDSLNEQSNPFIQLLFHPKNSRFWGIVFIWSYTCKVSFSSSYLKLMGVQKII